METDVAKTIELINTPINNKFSKYNKLYLFTTENLNYLENFKKKKVLSVCGSGDHAINAILFGAKTLTVFDINKLSKYLLLLKIEAIKTLNYNEFLDFFIFKEFDYNIFKKINQNNTLVFWEKLYKYFNYNNIYHNNLFIKNDIDFYFRNNPYLKEANYNILKQNILNISIEFINCDLLEIENKKSFDIILLSNISDYIDNIFKNNVLSNYNIFINKLKENNKIIIMAYLYDFQVKSHYRTDIDNIKNINKYFDNIKIYKFQGAYDTNKNDAIIVKE